MKLIVIKIYSKSTSNLAEELKNQQDQQERNSRYEELQKVKQQLKEEEETWTSVCYLIEY